MEDDAIRGLTGSLRMVLLHGLGSTIRQASSGRQSRGGAGGLKGHGMVEPAEPMAGSTWQLFWGGCGIEIWLVGAYAPAAFLGAFHRLRAGVFCGLAWWFGTSPVAAITPLMSVTNAISSIIAIGALVQIAPPAVQ